MIPVSLSENVIQIKSQLERYISMERVIFNVDQQIDPTLSREGGVYISKGAQEYRINSYYDKYEFAIMKATRGTTEI